MSIFDAERAQMGLPPIGESPSTNSPKTSIFAAEREAIFNPPKPVQVPQMTPEQFQHQTGMANAIDFTHSPIIQQANAMPAAEPQQSFADRVQQANFLDTIFKDNPVSRFLNYPIAKAAEDSIPNAPLIGANGEIPGTNAREDYAQRNPVLSTGNETADKVGDVLGSLGSFFTPIGGTGALNAINSPALQNIAQRFGSYASGGIENQVAQKAVNAAAQEAVKFAPQNVQYLAATDNQTSPSDVLKNTLEGGALGAGFGAAGSLVGSGLSKIADKYAGTALGDALGKLMDRSSSVAPEAEKATQETLSPYSSYAKPLENPRTLDTVMSDINQEVSQRITPPLENPKLLDQYLTQHLGSDIPKSEIDGLSYNDKAELAKHIQDNLSAHDVATQVAKEKGYDWNILSGQNEVKLNVPETKFKVGDSAIPTTADGADLSAAKKILDVQSKDGINYYRFDGSNTYMPENMVKQADKPIQPNVGPSKLSDFKMSQNTTVFPDTRIKGQQLKDFKTGDQVKFAKTVQSSEHTVPELKQSLIDEPITGARTSDVLNRQEANKIINKHGIEGTHDILMAKTKQFSAAENTAAQMVAKHLSSLGGKENLSKAISLVSKTARGGREMGQAIQSLSQWNKLDETGALLLGERQLNKGVEDTKDWKSLTPAQGLTITEPAQRIEAAAATKSLADEVLNIVTNKPQGEALTDAEKATIKQFNDQVKEINSKTKPFLPQEKGAKSDATIKEVSQIEPKARTRDQVVSFLDAKAEKARQRLAQSRNIGFAAVNKGNPVVDYAIIGASHIAKGVVKLSDFTEQMIKDFGDSVKPHINEVFNRANNIFRKENGLPTTQELDKAVNSAIKNGSFTEEQGHQFKAWANEIGHMSDEFKVEATQDLQKAMNQIGDSTLGQKLATIQTSMQLLSIPTAERNVIGNEAFNIIEKINKVTAVPVDWIVSKLTGERTIVFKTGNQEKYWSNFVKGAKGGWDGVSPNGQFAALDIHPEAFKSQYNPFRYLQKATGALLQSFDHAAYRRAYGETLGTYAKLTGEDINKLDQSIHELADHAGQYATFQDETWLSKLAVGTKQLLNKPTDLLSDAAVKAGLPEKYSMKGFGMGDLVLKYAKTPANIVMRGIDYSPIGILRGLGELVPLLGKKEFNQRQAILALSRGITGTLGLSGLGYALASAGILTGSASSDKDIQQLDRMTGKGEYKVNWSALERYVMGGLDKNVAQWQKGDRIFDWGWLQPMAISIAMGVNAQQSVAKQKTDGTSSMLTTIKDGLLGSMKTILQQPLLQGTQQLIEGGVTLAKYGSWSGIANILKGAPASFVPSTLNQARNFTDNTTRITYDPSKLQTALNMIINKIPGLDKQLPVAYDTLGNAKEQIQGGQANTLKQGLLSFASPVKPTTYTVSPEARMIMDLINATGDEKVAPRTPNSYIMVDKKKIPLSPDQYSAMQQKTGQATQQALARIAPVLANPKIKDEIKAKEVIGVLTRVGEQVRRDLERTNPEFRSHAVRR